MESYGYIAKEVAPKKARLKAAQDNLARQEASLVRARFYYFTYKFLVKLYKCVFPKAKVFWL